MGTPKFLLIAAAIALVPSGLRGEDAGQGLAYNHVNRTMQVLESQKIDGADCVPFYLKPNKEGEKLDADKAKFRIRTKDGEIILLKVSLLSDIPVKDRTTIEKKMIENGYTHVQWIPKNEKKFVDGSLLHDLPKGSIEMAQFLGISGKFPKEEKQK